MAKIIIIILAGVLVGFINTLSGGGSVISLSLLLILGLPADIANGTNRISIFFQTFSSAGMVHQHGYPLLELRQ